MKILMIGSGGREHALIKKLLESPKCEKLYCAPGNGGISRDAEVVNIGVMDKENMVKFAQENAIDLVSRLPTAWSTRFRLRESALSAPTPTPQLSRLQRFSQRT